MKLIYGIGTIGKEYVRKLVENGISDVVLTDSNYKLWGETVCGKEIIGPDVALKESYDCIIVTTNVERYNEIVKVLVDKYGISPNKIFRYTDTRILLKDVKYNLGNLSFKEELNKNQLVMCSGKEAGKLFEEEKMNDLEKYFFFAEHKRMQKWLHYFEVYDRFFSKYRGKDVTILEIGVSGGGSLQMWKNYFKKSDNKVTVYGIDIRPWCKDLEEEDIHIFIGSQEDRVFLREVKKQIGKVDILIDDGGHTMNQQITTLEELFDMIKDDGVYLCEDCQTSYSGKFGGGYKQEKSFIEYSKNIIDYLHSQYFEESECPKNIYSDYIKSISYFENIVAIEKKSQAVESVDMIITTN